MLILAFSCPAFAGPEDAPTTPSAPPAEASVNLEGVDVEGSIDPAGRIEALLETVARPGTPFVPSGDADRTGMPIGTIPRIKHVLNVVGYASEISEVPAAGGLRLHLRLRPFDRVRRIFVSGNQPNVIGGVRQEDMIGKLSIRPGQKLPPAGELRDAFIATEADHVRDFLRSSGYWEAEVRIELHDGGKVPAEINLLVRVNLGPAYPLGPLKVTGATALAPETIADGFRHGKWYTAWQLPQPFRRAALRQDLTNLVLHYRRVGFPGVRVQDDFDPDTSLDRQAKNVRLGIDIKERKHVAVAFEGNRSRSAGNLQDALTLLYHGAYDDVEATTSAQALEHDYHERGHMLVKVTWRRERLSEQSDRLVFVIDEGPMLKVRGIAFEGNRAIPTDSLYTLVADPFSLNAVRQVFRAKGREPHRSLPILVGGLVMAEELASELNNRFYLLARRFWPGPLTIIVPASARVPLKVTGNTGRLALRNSSGSHDSKIVAALAPTGGRPAGMSVIRFIVALWGAYRFGCGFFAGARGGLLSSARGPWTCLCGLAVGCGHPWYCHRHAGAARCAGGQR